VCYADGSSTVAQINISLSIKHNVRKFVVLGAVQQNRLTKSASQLDIENSIKTWLKFAPERAGKRRSREAAKKLDA